MVNFNTEHQVVLNAMLLGKTGVRAGKMFGFPAYYAGKKLAICLYEEGVGIKLPAATAEQLMSSDPKAVPFQPLGKPRMREWVQINLNKSEDYWKYAAVFEESIQFVLSLQ